LVDDLQVHALFSIKNDMHSASYLDLGVQYIWATFRNLLEARASDCMIVVYNEIVEAMLDDIDVHHYPLDADF